MALDDVQLDPDIIQQRIQDKIDLWRQSQPERSKVSLDKTTPPTNSPIDNQIANGVDFFDDDSGGHTGFVTKTDLRSRYHQFINGNVVAEKAGERINTKTRSAYGESGEYNEPPGIGLSSTSHIIDGDVLVPPRNHNGSYFASLLPIEDRASMYGDNSYTFNTLGTNPPNTSEYPQFNLVDQITLYGIHNLEDGGLWTISNQPGGFSFNNPVVDANVDFMSRLSGYESYLNNNNSTLTHTVPAIVAPKAIANSMMGTTATYQGTSNLGPFTNTFDNKYAGATGDSSTLTQLWDTTIRTGLWAYDESVGDLNQFTAVPNGLDTDNLFGTDNLRNVSNKGPFVGNSLHPIIVRKFQTNFADTPATSLGKKEGFEDPFGLLTDLYINMSGFSHTRLYRWSLENEEWFTLQDSLQSLNPTFETRKFEKRATIGDPNQPLGYTHIARHRDSEDNRYEKLLSGDTLPDFIVDNVPDSGKDITKVKYGFGSRIAMQGNYDINPDATVTLSLFGVTAGFEAGNPGIPLDQGIFYVNPNRYTGTISSAPVTIVDGIPSFIKNSGTGDGTTAKSDADKILNTQGGTFNKEVHSYDNTRSNIAQKYATLAYGRLNKLHSYEKNLKSPAELIGFIEDGPKSEGSIFPSATVSGELFGVDFTVSLGDVPSTHDVARRNKEKRINDAVGNQGIEGRTGATTVDPVLGVIKKSVTGTGISAGAYDGTDKINMAPYGTGVDGDKVNFTDSRFARDFVKFRFYDVVNNKYIIFRALLSGISDTITPDYGEDKYIGRPDKLYTYKGADRDVSFSFKVYPKTKQEFPVLIEKLNYLVGLCYPSISTQQRMKTPFMNLTIGDMFVEAPGILRNVTVTVEDNTTWEITEGLQFPKHISVACQYRYIGNHLPVGTSSNWYGGLRPSDVDNPTAEDIFNKYVNFDFGHDGSVIDQAVAYVDDKLGISKAIDDTGKKVGKFISNIF